MTTCSLLLRSCVGTGLLALSAAPAVAQNQTFLDLEAGLGYSTNPALRFGNDLGSGFGRLSAYGFHSRASERETTNLSAYVENISYLRRLGNRQIFDLGASHTRQASETLRLFGEVRFSGDFGAQLSSRFVSVPDTIISNPVIPDNLIIVTNPDLAALDQRQYRLSGQAGASFALSQRESIGTSFGVQRIFLSGGSALTDYNLYDFTASYRMQINERLSAGARGIASYADYDDGRSVLSYGPQATAELRLAESLQLSAAIGFVRTERDLGALGGESNSFDLALDASLCRTLADDRFCLQASRRNQSSVLGASPSSTSLSGTFSRRLSASDDVQASIGLVQSGGAPEVGLAKQTFYTVAGAYNRKISDRLSTGVNLAARKLSVAGPDAKTDLSGSVFIRNRFGSVR